MLAHARPRRMPSLQRQKGFTLVELMVVVAIIALIATIIIPNFVHSRQQAATSASEGNLKQIATALELYFADNYSYPPGNGVAVTPQTLFGSAQNNYMSQTPVDPAAGTPYTYTVMSGGQGYRVDAPGGYEPSTLAKVGDSNGSTATVGTSLHYTPQIGIFKS